MKPGDTIDVTLSWYESRLAGMVGLDRHINSIRDARKPAAGFTGNSSAQLAIHVTGAGGELAFCKALNRYWPATVNTFSEPDAAGRVQVRATEGEGNRLIVRPGDADGDIFVHVTGVMPNYKVWGWIVGANAKQDIFNRAPGGRPPAYFVGTNYLCAFRLTGNECEDRATFDRNIESLLRVGAA